MTTPPTTPEPTMIPREQIQRVHGELLMALTNLDADRPEVGATSSPDAARAILRATQKACAITLACAYAHSGRRPGGVDFLAGVPARNLPTTAAGRVRAGEAPVRSTGVAGAHVGTVASVLTQGIVQHLGPAATAMGLGRGRFGPAARLWQRTPGVHTEIQPNDQLLDRLTTALTTALLPQAIGTLLLDIADTPSPVPLRTGEQLRARALYMARTVASKLAREAIPASWLPAVPASVPPVLLPPDPPAPNAPERPLIGPLDEAAWTGTVRQAAQDVGAELPGDPLTSPTERRGFFAEVFARTNQLDRELGVSADTSTLLREATWAVLRDRGVLDQARINATRERTEGS